jgi:hypothetical protein
MRDYCPSSPDGRHKPDPIRGISDHRGLEDVEDHPEYLKVEIVCMCGAIGTILVCVDDIEWG